MGKSGSSGNLAALQAQVEALKSETATHQQDTLKWRQKFTVAAALLATLSTSRLGKLARQLRALRRCLLPRKIDVDALIPWQHLEAKPGEPDSWFTLSDDAAFLIPCLLERGWVRIDVRVASASRGVVRLFVETGGELRLLAGISLETSQGVAERCLFSYFPASADHLRLEPLNARGEIRLERLRVTQVPRPIAALYAIRSKLRVLLANGGIGRAIRTALRLLCRGDWRRIKAKLLGELDGSVHFRAAPLPNLDPYTRWRQMHQLTDKQREEMRKEIDGWEEPPLISVLVPVYNVPERFLRLAIESVLKQVYPHWELCIADDHSTQPHVRRVLDEYARRDPRIKVVYRMQNGNISAASNSALAVAQGDYLALLDHDDELAEHALFRMAKEIVAEPSVDMLYSDEDKLEIDGRHVDPFFKPVWSPEYFLACMYTCHLGVYRAELVRSVGGFRSEFDSAQDYDLVLRLMAHGAKIQHVPDVLYHWRKLPTSTASAATAKPESGEVARQALRSYLEAIGRPGTVEPAPVLTYFNRVRFAIQDKPKVSIIIASACKQIVLNGERTFWVNKSIGSIREKSTYDNVEILLVSNHDVVPDLAEQLKRWGVKLVMHKAPFNWSAVQNLGAATASGDYLLFMNDDMELITPDWLESLLEFAQIPEIGAVGPKLLYPDGRLQHAGVLMLDGNPTHAFHQYPKGHNGYFCNNVLHRNVIGVTGACLMTRPDVFEAIGGFDITFPLEFNDVDFCLKIISSGRRIVYMPYAELYHYESATRPNGVPLYLSRFKERWKDRLGRDPYLNPNLSPYSLDYRIDVPEAA